MKLAALSLACLLLAGCHVVKHNDGGKENVDIGTPFGSMKVNTDKGGSTDTSAIGLSVYPGATPFKDSDDGKASDSNNANVDMSFGSFHLGVRSATFRTADAQEKVLAFYRKDMAKYGDVIECKDNVAVGTPARTAQGLTCDEHHHHGFNVTGDKDGLHINDTAAGALELRAGSQQHQHIVGLEPKDGAVKIGLVALDLPKDLSHSSGESE